MLELTDSHAHLDLLADPEDALIACREQGIRQLISVGIDIASSRKAVAYAAQHPEVLAAVGIHPHEADDADAGAISELESLALNSSKVVAIGETGLDYYRDRCPREAQKNAFIKQIELARTLDIALIVHSREAHEDTLALLDEHARGLTVILHCFAIFDKIDICAERNYFMSIAGNVTFPKAVDLREAASRIPDHLLLTETDSPYLTPVPNRGKPNNPANVRYVLSEIAHLRGMSPEALANRINRNFHTAFSL